MLTRANPGRVASLFAIAALCQACTSDDNGGPGIDAGSAADTGNPAPVDSGADATVVDSASPPSDSSVDAADATLPSSNDAGDAAAADASDAGEDAGDASDAGLTSDASDAGLTSDANDAGLDASDAAAPVATIFLSDSINGVVYRYTITPTTDPVLDGTLNLPSGGIGTQGTAVGMATSPAGELFIASLGNGLLYRFLDPLGAATPNGTLTVPGLSAVEEIHFVDGQLWAPNVNPTTCSTSASSMVEVRFGADGGTTTATSSVSGFIAADRGMLWVPSTRDLFESHCDPTDTIAHYAVAADESLSALPTISGNGLLNPHGMSMAAWGELFVSNAGVAGNQGTTLLRFTFDATGNPIANGTVTGNGLSTPIGQAFTPWGELLVVNQGSTSISRFTFDALHAAVANGNPAITGPSVVDQGGLGWILVVPGSSTNLLDAGASDAAPD